MAAPHRGSCKGCGVPVMWADTPDEGRICLDSHESVRGENRHVLNDDGYVVPVHARREVMAYTAHVCHPFGDPNRRHKT
jgi:hypothetical protein